MGGIKARRDFSRAETKELALSKVSPAISKRSHRRIRSRRVAALVACKLGRLIDQAVASGRPRPHGAAGDADPEDISPEEFRLRIARRLNDIRGAFRRCPASVCRRVQACADPALPCLAAVAPPRGDEENLALSVLRKSLERQRSAVEAEDRDAARRQ